VILRVTEMEKILITGTSGLLGGKIVKQTRVHYTVIPTYNTKPLFPNSVEMNITDERRVLQVFSNFRPDIVVHVAAETNVDRCEVDKEHAWKVNAEGTRNIARMCNRVGARIVYVSTDYVFDGEKGLYTEEDEPNPISYYGLTKLEGEKYVTEICRDHVIVRTSVLYGWHPWKPNFVKWVIKSLRESKQISVVNDHFASPTLADNLAEVILEIIEKDLKGLYHTAGRERINRFEFVLKIAETFGLDSSLIKPIKMSELKEWVAKRPRDSSLCVDKIQKKLKTKLVNVKEGLRKMEEEVKREGYNFTRRTRKKT
jgi:dTDP-4-dehydrorhamnose reductase